MRIIVFFDLPMQTSKDGREYRKFRKFLVQTGFFMLQKSVYSKLALNQSAVRTILSNLKKNKPEKGLVQAIILTEKQYQNMELILGEFKTDILETDERLVIF